MFWSRFVYYCESVGKAPNVVASEIGIKSSGTVTGWKNGAIPRASVLAKLAEYFGVSIHDFMGEETEKPTPASEDGLDPELVALIKRIPVDRMPEVERYLRFQAESGEKP